MEARWAWFGWVVSELVELQNRRKPHTFGKTTHDQGAGDDGEGQLKSKKDRFQSAVGGEGGVCGAAVEGIDFK